LNDEQYYTIEKHLNEGKQWIEIYKIFSYWFPSTTALKKSFVRYRQRYNK